MSIPSEANARGKEANARGEEGLSEILEAMSHIPDIKPARKPPPPPRDPTPEEQEAIDQLPDAPGFYWVESLNNSHRNVAFIDKGKPTGKVEHWGDKTSDHSSTKRWVQSHVVLTFIEPYSDPLDYTNNSNYGVF